MQEHGLITHESSIYYRLVGEGEPVILLHGFGEDGSIWDALSEQLKKKYRLIIPDLPGSGQSVSNTDGITMEKMAEKVKEVLDKEGIQQCKMIGHSMGGYITLAFAEKYAHYLHSFGLFHSTAYADSEEKKEARKKNIEFIGKHGSAKFLRQTVPNLFSEETRSNNPELVEQIINKYSNLSPTSLVNYTAAMMNRPDRVSVLENFKKPVLFIMGEHDTAVPLEQGLKQCRVPEISYIYICVHSGHMGMLEEPEFSLKAIQDFLSAK